MTIFPVFEIDAIEILYYIIVLYYIYYIIVKSDTHFGTPIHIFQDKNVSQSWRHICIPCRVTRSQLIKRGIKKTLLYMWDSVEFLGIKRKSRRGSSLTCDCDVVV